jgi:dipeptidyl-peptidase-4
MTRRLLPLLVLFIVFSAVAQEKKQLSLEDFVVNKTFKEQKVEGINSMNDGLHFSSLVDETKIVKYSYKTGEQVAVIFDLNTVDECPVKTISAYTFSSDEQKILLETNVVKNYRHSYSANYYVWNLATQEMLAVSDYGPQQVATFSPDGERVAFVRENNLFIKSLRFKTEQQVTFDGKKNEIINGIPDWVYEEEFSYNKAFEWSPDSKTLAFAKFNETEVKEFSMPTYKGLSPEKTENSLYPGQTTFKYPKAGEKNSVVTVHVYDVKTKTTIRMKTGDDTDVYIPRIKWAPDAMNLAILRLNRLQNELTILYANPNTGDTRNLLIEKNKRYIDEQFLDLFQFLPDNNHFVILSERDGWSHLYLYKNSGILDKQLTKGNFDVTNFYGFDKEKAIFYYEAAKVSPLEREVYSLTFDGKKEMKLSEQAGTNKAIFSNGFQYFINEYSSSKTPLTFTVNDKTGKTLRTLEENKALKEKLNEYTLPRHEFFSFKTSEGIDLNGYMLKPSNFDATKKYPVVMTQYSGPNSQEVLNSWSIDWHYYLAEQGFIVACVDQRGTAARGEEFRKCTYMQLGKMESDDQIEAAKYLGSLAYVDKNNIAIWGWSYGGFMASLCMEKGGNIFKAGVAVAPVTNWRFYDSVYTERFMRTPQQNPNGYDDNSPVTNPKGITGKFLLIHGTADDNVHAQNSFEFAEALVQAGVPFDMMMYTNRNHNITGGNTRLHLFNKLLSYFEEHLK